MPVVRIVALLALTVSVAVGASEALLRVLPSAIVHPSIAGYPWMRRDDFFGMVNEPGRWVDPPFGGGRLEGTVRINALGMRGEEIEAPSRRRRIVCLGDSSTFGIHLAEGVAGDARAVFRADNAYPERLAALVDAEIVNAGVIGYNSGHGVRQLRGRLLPELQPDVVVVRFGFNDHAFVDPATIVREPRPPLDGLLYAGRDLEITRLVLRAARTRSVAPPAVPLERFVRNLESMVALARAAGAHVVLVDYPLRPLVPGERADPAMMFMGLPSLDVLYATHARYQAALQHMAESVNVPVVRTDDVVSFEPVDRVHPSASGAEAIARRIAAAVLP